MIYQTYNILVILGPCKYPCHPTLFADDTTIAFSNKNISDLENIINDTLVLIHKWLCNNRLHIHIEKN